MYLYYKYSLNNTYLKYIVLYIQHTVVQYITTDTLYCTAVFMRSDVSVNTLYRYVLLLPVYDGLRTVADQLPRKMFASSPSGVDVQQHHHQQPVRLAQLGSECACVSASGVCVCVCVRQQHQQHQHQHQHHHQ